MENGNSNSKLLITSGVCGRIGDPCPVEVIDFNGGTETCNGLPNYLGNVYGATGGLVGNAIVSCGGYSTTSWTRHDKCYKLGTTTPVATMSKKRMYAASVVVGNKLWITGGSDDTYVTIKSTEFVDPVTGTVEPGPDLPQETCWHCMVMINSSTAMLIGRFALRVPNPRDRTWFYNFDNQERGWIRGPDLNVRRFSLACGVLKDSGNEGKTLVVAAG